MTDYDPSFEKLWSVYPKRNGRKTKKSPAYKKWLTLDAGEKAALATSVDRHNREQSWGKYVRDLVTFINQGGWEDEVDDPVQAATPRYHLAPEPYDCSKWTALANRLFRDWLRVAGGLPDDLLVIGIEVKNKAVLEMADALDEDIAAAGDDRMAKTEPLWTFRNVLYDRLDMEFGRNLKPLLLKGAN